MSHEGVVVSALAVDSDRPETGLSDVIAEVGGKVGTADVGSAEGTCEGELGRIDGADVGPIEIVGPMDGVILG